MKTFVVLSCLLAVAYGAIYGGGSSYGGSRYAAQEHSSHSSHVESHQSSAQHTASGLASGLSAGGLGAGGLGAGGLVGGAGGLVSGLGANSYDVHSAGSALNSYGASSLGAATIASRNGYDAYGSEYGAGLHEAAVTGGHGLGLASGGYGGLNEVAGQSISSRSSHVSRSYSSSSSSSSVINYRQYYPELYEAPLFQNLCNLKSTVRSEELLSTLGTRGFDYGSEFSSLYTKNALLQKYFYAATGISYEERYRSNYAQLINEHPAQALRAAVLFARNPQLYTSPFGKFVIGGTSLELLQGYSQNYNQYTYNSFANSQFVHALFRSKYYVNTLSRIFGYSSRNLPFEALQQNLLSQLTTSYRSYPAGTLLFLRHVLARRKITSFDYYRSVTDYSSYSSNSFWRNKSWRHNPYYDIWSSKFGGSSYAASSYRSSRSVSRSSSAVSSAGVHGLSGGYI